ncbi:hypothetical protein KVV02_004354 [Mortierella alpina]|uniref:BZIP domain-containing protein n=1 Tax=Mortierella alpina TaxID=64518 RepID=A0A9P8A7X1_MORAP|nr:hypothetical protein KVV02_004354 [Mortierella alpina]
MAISIDFPMFDMTNPKLSKSADALESALAQFGKNATPCAAVHDNSNFIAAPTVTNNGSGFDEWLASDFQFGVLSGDDSSLSSSPFSALEDSPVLGLDSFNAVMGPSLFDMDLGFTGADVVPSTVAASPVLSVSVDAPSQIGAPPMLTTAAVQQAAAALNIPWSHDLELAVMAQAANNASPVLPLNAPAMVIPKLECEPMVSVNAVDTSKDKGSKKRAASPEDEMDEIVAKRAKNTDAARRSRLKKLIKLEGLEAKVADLESANNGLTMKVAVLETEKNGHLVKEAEQSARIAQLEAKLAEAHAALTSRA